MAGPYDHLDGHHLLQGVAADFKACKTVRELEAAAAKAQPYMAKIKALNEGWYHWLRANWLYLKGNIDGTKSTYSGGETTHERGGAARVPYMQGARNHPPHGHGRGRAKGSHEGTAALPLPPPRR